MVRIAGAQGSLVVTFLLLALMVTLLAACGRQDDPFLIADRKELAEQALQPAASVGAASGIPAPEVRTKYTEQELENRLYEQGVGTIKLGDWKDKGNSLYNNILGYIMVYGYDYSIDLVDLEPNGYEAALVSGEVDAVMDMSNPESPGWYQEHIKAGTVLGTGSLFSSRPGSRIGVHASLNERAPEVVQFLGRVTPTDEVLDGLEARMTGGRTGIRANVAALMFLKRHEDLWTKWVEPPVAQKVKDAIAAGKSSLKNVKCQAVGGKGSVGSPSCDAR